MDPREKFRSFRSRDAARTRHLYLLNRQNARPRLSRLHYLQDRRILRNLEVIDGRVAVIGTPDAAQRAKWILGRNFGVSAAATRRGPGGEIYSRRSASAAATRRGPGEEIYSRGPTCVNLSVILHKNRKDRGENLCKSIDNSRGFAKMKSGSREYFTRRIPDEHRLTHCEESERRLRDHEGGDKSQTGCQKMPTGSERQGT